MLSASGRQYKSRKARPCDFCRGRKVACHMEHGPPCRLCAERQRPCTFVQAPGKRKRRTGTDPAGNTAQGSGPDEAEAGEHRGASASQTCLPDRDTLSSPGRLGLEHDVFHDSLQAGEGLLHPNFDMFLSPQQSRESPVMESSAVRLAVNSETSNILVDAIRSQVSTHSYDSSGLSQVPATTKDSLESLPDVSYRAVGLTGDLDLYVLSHRRYDGNDESTVQYPGLRYRRMSTNTAGVSVGAAMSTQIRDKAMIPPPVFTVVDLDLTALSDPKVDKHHVDEAENQLRTLISPNLGYRLSLLYAEFVHPTFPILSSRQLPRSVEDVSSMPLSLLAAISATAVPFITYDDVLSVRLPHSPSQNELFRLAWVLVSAELHAPHLSTIQACLMMLQQHATNRYAPSTPFRPTIMSTTVTLCHCLGLHRDSSQWTSLPRWERQLRKRIWWATWMMEKWISLGESIPSALNEDNFDVQPLTKDDMDDHISQPLQSDQPDSHFSYLVSLTTILAEVVDTFFTVRSSARTSVNLELSLEAAKPLRAMLKRWHDSLPSDIKSQVSPLTAPGSAQGLRQMNSASFCRLNTCGSFYLAYLIVQMTLFRALLRPVSVLATLSWNMATEDNDETGFGMPAEHVNGAKAVIAGTLAIVKEVIDFAENLGGSEWDAFWHSWSRSNFAIVACVMLNLLIILRPPLSPTRAMGVATTTPSPSAFPQHHYSRSQQQPQLLPNTNSFLDLQDEYRTLLDYVTRWRWAMKISSRGAGGRKGLMNLSLLRMDALMSEMSNVSPLNDAENSPF